jgi:hypothetical protein
LPGAAPAVALDGDECGCIPIGPARHSNASRPDKGRHGLRRFVSPLPS